MNAASKNVRGNFLRKITPSTVMGAVHNDDKWMTKLGATRPVPAQILYDLFGQVARARVGTTEKGEYVQFKGRFTAVTPDGEEFISGAAHIPVMEDMLFAALQDAHASDPKAVIEIAVRIGIVTAPSDKPSATGYEYVVHRLIEHNDASDPIARMRAEVSAKALAAPASTSAAPATAVAPSADPAHKHTGGSSGKRR